jgi:hypothetical protein
VQSRFGQRRGGLLVKVDHHLGDTRLGRPDAAIVAGEAQVLTDGRLNAITVERLALDGGGTDRLMTHQGNAQGFAVRGAEVLRRADDDPGPSTKIASARTSLWSSQVRRGQSARRQFQSMIDIRGIYRSRNR